MATRATFATLAPDWASTTIRFFFSGFGSRRRQGMSARTASAGAATSSTTRWLPSVSASHVPVVYGMDGTTPGEEADLRAVVWAASTEQHRAREREEGQDPAEDCACHSGPRPVDPRLRRG